MRLDDYSMIRCYELERERTRGTEKSPDICAVDPGKNRVREIGAAIERGMKCLTWMGRGTSLRSLPDNITAYPAMRC